MRIGLLSDTHNYLDQNILNELNGCQEIWHAGDLGTMHIAEQLQAVAPVKAVSGNIDGKDVRAAYPEVLRFRCEEVNVLMTHIGGYPPKYNAITKPILTVERPQLFICGHSHILKIMFDEKLNCLHMNPGAAGKQGWHKVRTLIRFTIDGKNMKDCEVVELS